MAKNGVKFYRLGLNSPEGVSVAKYNQFKLPGAMVFAKVNVAAGTWDSEESLYKAPAYYIWANGLEYKVADADALQYALEHLGSSEQKLKEIDASIDRLDSSVNSLEEIVAEIQASYVKSLSVDSSVEGGTYVVLDPVLEQATGDVQLSIGLKIADVSTVTEEGAGLADAYSVKKYVLAKVAEAGHLSYKVVDELPETGEENVIYLVPAKNPSTGDIYQEWMWIDGKWELIGDTSIKLQDYYTKKEVDAKVADLSTAIDDLEEKEIADVSTLQDAIDTLEEELVEEQERAEAKEAEIDSSIAEIKAVDASQEAHLSQLDSSVNALEEVVLTGVVNSLEVEDKVQSDYVSLAADTSRGNVTVTLDGKVVDASTAEYQGIANNGLATVGYVEERLDQYNWIEIEEEETPSTTPDASGNVNVESTSTQPQLVSLSNVAENASTLSLSSANSEITVEGK